MKKISKFIWISMPIILIIGTFAYINKNRKEEKQKEIYQKQFWEQCDVEFCGVVLDKTMIERGAGYVCLQETYANKNNFELYINNEVFICQLKEDKIIFVTEVVQLNIGDSICFNIDGNKSEQRFRQGKEFLTFQNSVISKTKIDYNPENFICK